MRRVGQGDGVGQCLAKGENMQCPKCESSHIVEWNKVDVALDVDGEQPDGTLVYGTWKPLLDSIEICSRPEPYQCRDCDHEFARA